jgi:uncharacterized SAM-binding protein YcdF (DUF218 family)
MTRRRRLLGAVLIALVLVAVLAHRSILGAIGAALVVEDPLEQADAIVVLAGGMPSRETKAAALYRDGWAPRVIISRPPVTADLRELIRTGIRPRDLQGDSRLVLEKHGVPSDRIVEVTETAATTEAELRLVHALAHERGYRRVILVTWPPHTRRVKVIWERETRRDRLDGRVVVAPIEDFSLDGWWRKRRVAEAVLHEYLGLLLIYLGLSPYMS